MVSALLIIGRKLLPLRVMSSQALKEFKKFYLDHYDKAYWAAFDKIGERSVCEDIVADVFSNIYEKYLGLDYQQMQRILVASVSNRCIDYLRHKKVESKYAFLMQKLEEENYNLEEDPIASKIEKERLISSLKDISSSFSPKTAEVLSKCFVEKKKYREAAQDLGVTEAAIKKHIVKALRIFRERIKLNG